ncbi:MAG: hypothetical protein ACLQU3_03500 [Limisphaerales bacterium]
MNEASKSWGKELLGALTEEQIERLLDVVTRTGALEKLDKPLQAIDPDLAQTVRALIGSEESASAASPQARVSDQKALETWNGLWGEWEGHVSEVGDAEGEYAVREPEWDPPYFDSRALADDLEKIAQQTLEWLDRVFPLDNEPNVFAQALREIDENINRYPEWILGDDSFCALGPNATACVLRWTWRACEGQAARGREFLERTYGLEQEYKRVGLDDEQCVKFFAALPEEFWQEIHARLSEEEYTEAREDTRSVWHRIHHHLERRFDPSAYLQSCETHLPSDWHYGEALITDALDRKDFAQAEVWMERTFASFARWPEDEVWLPEDSLLPPAGHYHYGAVTTEDAVKLLEQWETIAARGKGSARAAGCRLQLAVLASSSDWPEVLRAFEEFQQQGGARKVAEKLFTEWRNRTANECVYGGEQKQRPEDSWVSWLIEARRAPATHKKTLLDHLDVWLECFQRHASFFEKQWRSLALLTRVLPSGPTFKERFPTFHAHVLVPSLGLDAKLERSLREALSFLGVDVGQFDPMSIWEKHLHTLVPSPEGTGSYYREQALWMKALNEVNRTAYDKLLAQWRVVYRRRRNLWAEMNGLQLPGL